MFKCPVDVGVDVEDVEVPDTVDMEAVELGTKVAEDLETVEPLPFDAVPVDIDREPLL